MLSPWVVVMVAFVASFLVGLLVGTTWVVIVVVFGVSFLVGCYVENKRLKNKRLG